MRLRARIGWSMVLLATAGQVPTLRAADAAPEDELKAAVVLSFLRYTEWSPGNTPVTVGVVGRPSLAKRFRASLEGKVVRNRPIRVLDLKSADNPSCCQIYYFAGDRVPETSRVLEEIRVARALSIGECDRFLEVGGVIVLRIVDGRMSFDVNLEALGHSGIEISSKLLRLGHVISRRPA